MLSDQVLRLRAATTSLELRGRAVSIDGRQVLLGPTALAVFRRLATSGSVVSRRELFDALPVSADEHAREVAISRLRHTFGSPGLMSTVVKGYRLNATPDPG